MNEFTIQFADCGLFRALLLDKWTEKANRTFYSSKDVFQAILIKLPWFRAEDVRRLYSSARYFSTLITSTASTLFVVIYWILFTDSSSREWRISPPSHRSHPLPEVDDTMSKQSTLHVSQPYARIVVLSYWSCPQAASALFNTIKNILFLKNHARSLFEYRNWKSRERWTC